ncbi:MAG: MBL fold metallo-hydrolase, partial [Ilumatobacteraceae bacterium]
DGDGYDVSLMDLGHDVLELDGAHDVFGDGSVTCIPTPGHTCGHQSLRVACGDGVVILASDACYFARTLDDEQLPPFAHDHDRQRRSLLMLQRERAAGATIVPGHDATVFRSMLT